MKIFYKIVNGAVQLGSGTVMPKGFIEYTIGQEPQELLDELFEQSKHTKINEIKQAYNEANQLDIAYMNTTFQADKESQNLIVSVLSTGTVPDGFYWVDSLNNQVAMTYADLQGLSAEILVRGQANFDKYQALKAQVSVALTETELETIVW